MVLRRLLATLLLAAATATPAMADVFDHASVELHFVQENDGIHAVAMVHSTWGAQVDADVRLVVNGYTVKVEPVTTRGDARVSTWIAPVGLTIFACADLAGTAWTGGDSHQDVQERACAFQNSEMTPNPVAPRTPLQPPVAPTAGRVRQAR